MEAYYQLQDRSQTMAFMEKNTQVIMSDIIEELGFTQTLGNWGLGVVKNEDSYLNKNNFILGAWRSSKTWKQGCFNVLGAVMRLT